MRSRESRPAKYESERNFDKTIASAIPPSSRLFYRWEELDSNQHAGNGDSTRSQEYDLLYSFLGFTYN